MTNSCKNGNTRILAGSPLGCVRLRTDELQLQDHAGTFTPEERAMTPMPAATYTQAPRPNARAYTERAAANAGHEANRTDVLIQLSHALASDLVGMLRFRRHYFMARSIHAKSVSAKFSAHSNEEPGHTQYDKGKALEDMITEVLEAERIAIDRYREMAKYLRHDDPTTNTMLREILAEEKEHADHRADLLERLPSKVQN